MWTRPFLSLWFARTSIALANVIYIMVITTFIYQKTNSALISSLFPLLKVMINLIAGFTSPFLYNKFAYPKLFVYLQLVKAIFLTVLFLSFTIITSNIILLLIMVMLISFMEGWGNPLLQSATPKLVPIHHLVKSNSVLSIATQSAEIAGYSFTAFAVIHLGHSPVLAFNAGLFWIALVCLYIASKGFAQENNEASTSKKTSKWGVMKEGWQLIWRNPTLRIVTTMDVIEGIAGSVWIGAITLVYVKEALHQEEQWWGFINSSYYVGTITGGLLILLIAKYIQKHLIISMGIGSLIFSIFTFIYGLTSSPILALLLCIAMGPAYQIRDVAQQTAFQMNIPSSQLTKVYASHSIILSSSTGISIALMGFIADYLGVRNVYILSAILIFISAILSFNLLRAMSKHKDTKIAA